MLVAQEPYKTWSKIKMHLDCLKAIALVYSLLKFITKKGIKIILKTWMFIKTWSIPVISRTKSIFRVKKLRKCRWHSKCKPTPKRILNRIKMRLKTTCGSSLKIWGYYTRSTWRKRSRKSSKNWVMTLSLTRTECKSCPFMNSPRPTNNKKIN